MKRFKLNEIQLERLDRRTNDLIRSAFLHRSFSEEEMLKKGVEFIIFTHNFHRNKKTEYDVD